MGTDSRDCAPLDLGEGLGICIFHMQWASLVAQTVKNLPGNTEDLDLIPGSGRSPGEGKGSQFQSSCLGNSVDRGA